MPDGQPIEDIATSAERSSRHRVTVVFSEHSVGTTFSNGTIWPDETLNIIQGLQPRPQVIAPDSLFGGVYRNYIEAFVPIHPDSLSRFLSDGETLFIVGADIYMAGVSNIGEAGEAESQRVWNQLYDVLRQRDPSFTTGGDPNEYFSRQVRQAYGIENASAAFVATVGSLLLQMLKRENKQVTVTDNAQGPPSEQPPNPARRWFLKGVAKSLGFGGFALALSHFRMPVFFDVANTEEAIGSQPSLIQAVAEITRPILINSEYLLIRNAKVGLATFDALEHVAPKGATGAVIFGGGHRLGVFPGQRPGESVEQTTQRLVDYLDSQIAPVVRELRARGTVPPELMALALTELLATYDVYEVAQDWQQSGGYSFDLRRENMGRVIQPVVDVIYRHVFGDSDARG